MLDYPHPPFPSQQQPMPGTTGAMKPRPDHGETSYKGSGRPNGKKAVITEAIAVLAAQSPLRSPGRALMS
jgi:hypothetical protein